MKCSRCGFVSFDYLDVCKGCGKDLIESKEKLNILSIVPSTESLNDLAPELEVDTIEEQEMIETTDSFIQPTEMILKEGPVASAVGDGLESEEELLLDELSDTGLGKLEDTLDLSLDDDLEESFTIEDDVEEMFFETEEVSYSVEGEEPVQIEADVSVKEKDKDTDVKMSENTVISDISIGLGEDNTETVSLDSSDVEVIEFEEDDTPLTKDGSKGEPGA